MKYLIVLYLLYYFDFAMAALSCNLKGQIRYMENKKQKVESKAYCLNPEEDLFYSHSCKTKKNCLALKKYYLPKSMNQLSQTIGDPLFTFCFLFDGTPMIVEYLNQKQWVPSSICMFDDKSFVNLNYLYQKGIIFPEVRELKF